MNKKQQQPNPARIFLESYKDARYRRLRFLAIGPEAREVHGQEIEALEATMRDVTAMIARLDSIEQRDVLMMRYVNCWPWSRIIFEMSRKGYGESMCYTLHGRALQHVNRMLSEQSNS